MIKYIRTFYNDEKVIMKVTGCQHCPLMKFDMIDTKCTCRYFFSTNNKLNVVDSFVIDYTEQGIVHERIKIPIWCGLSDHISDLVQNKMTYRAFKSSILTADNDDDTDLELIDAEKLQNHESILLDNFLLQINGGCSRMDTFGPPEDIPDDDSDIPYTSFEEINNMTYGYQSQVNKQEVCSLCGKDDENVKRNKNIGMCDTCWELFKDNEDKKKQAYINNFRMKRDKDFPTQSFKMLDELKIV